MCPHAVVSVQASKCSATTGASIGASASASVCAVFIVTVVIGHPAVCRTCKPAPTEKKEKKRENASLFIHKEGKKGKKGKSEMEMEI